MQAKRGFTLVEILIVVVILGILAAIVVPQFTQASTEAKYNSLCSNLQSIRSQIELYKVQHNDDAPTDPNQQLIYCTDIEGVDNDTKVRTGDYVFGPYLERIPVNPFNNQNGIAVGATAYGTAGATDGWEYNQQTGEIRAAADDTDETDAHQAL